MRLRPARPQDADFLYRLYASARGEELELIAWPDEVKEAFLRQQLSVREADYAWRHPTAERSIIEDRGEAIGSLYVSRDAEGIALLDIEVLPEHRGRGTGRRLIERLQREAGERDVPLRLQVGTTNRARRLYEGLGFRDVGGDEVYRRLEWRATEPAPC
jgi:ribosomal protein S18 acetylase RimI-like enzyme